MPEQLVAAADGQQGGAVLDGARDRVALALQHVLGDQHLVAVLAAADVDQVVLGRVEILAGPAPCTKADPTPLASPLEEEDVPPVGVDVHLLGIEREQSQFAVMAPHRTRHGVGLAGPERIACRAPAHPACDASCSSSGLSRYRSSSWTLRVSSPSGETALAQAPNPERRRPPGPRGARWNRPSRPRRACPGGGSGAVAIADAGSGRRTRPRPLRRTPHPGRSRRQAPGAAAAARRARPAGSRAAAPPPAYGGAPRSSDARSARSPRSRRDRAEVRCSARLRARPPGPCRARCDHRRAASGEVDRDPPGPGTELQHRAAVLWRKVRPHRQVADVGAELDVLPDGRWVGRYAAARSWARSFPVLAGEAAVPSYVRSSSRAV